MDGIHKKFTLEKKSYESGGLTHLISKSSKMLYVMREDITLL